MALGNVLGKIKAKKQADMQKHIATDMPELKQKGRHFALCPIGDWRKSENRISGEATYSRAFLSAYNYGWEIAFMSAKGNVSYSGFTSSIRRALEFIRDHAGSLPIESPMDAATRIVEALRERTGIADLPMPEDKEDFTRVGREIDEKCGTAYIQWPPTVLQNLFAKERAGDVTEEDDATVEDD